MQRLLKTILWILVSTFTISILFVFVGLGYIWFVGPQLDPPVTDLPYIAWLLPLTIGEVAGIVLLAARKALAYFPTTETNKSLKDTEQFMARFLSSGTSATIVSNRLSWLADSPTLQGQMAQLAQTGTRIEVITPQPVDAAVVGTLSAAGVRFFVTGECEAPAARFTLINADRSGSEKLAISRGVHPSHEITVFDSNSGPQIMAMAQDIITKAKRLANATPME